MLTDLQCRRASQQDGKDKKYYDTGGLYLLVTKSGKYWRLKYRVGGREKKLAIGVYPSVGLSAARAARDRAREVIAAGGDPSAAKHEERREAAAAYDLRFERVASQWIESQRTRWSPRHAQRILRSLEINVYPAIGSCDIRALTPMTLLDCLRVVERRGCHETATRVRARIAEIFRWARVAQICESNPAADLRGALTPPRPEHYAAPTIHDLGALVRAIHGYDGDPRTALGLWLTLLTLTRTTEVRFGRWSEIDSDSCTWVIPADRMKSRREHIVPLSQQAVAALRNLQMYAGTSAYLIPSPRRPEQPISANTMLYAMYRMGYRGRSTVHGFRSVGSSWLNEQQRWSPDAIERQLAHAPADKIRAAYHRSQYLDMRRDMLRAWADHLSQWVP